ncbi:RNA chaperone Hfq [Bacillus sp. CDB3]|uniref:RNA chaperone Hfq n=1 Tax=Bacillus sp. CDB3 TaxID=360310 RepID=UPI0009D8CB6D|nr:RNA chaperone Hfq [Bacillus sp. CDB3]OQR53575.1 RNA chaperone Hfq [Bacillus sp. CDB3]OQR53581.1 RNA chaperone Hfq [Bacillus sp. CDB3]
MERKVQTVQKERTMNTVSFQDRLLQEAMQKKKIVTLILLKGFQIKGTIKGYDAFSILIESEGAQQLFYKHTISTVRL